MSRVVKIKGNLFIENMEIAHKALSLCPMKNVTIQNHMFVFEGYDYYDGIHKNREIDTLEQQYKTLLADHYRKLEEEKQRLEKIRLEQELEAKRQAILKRLEELKRIEEEKKRMEEEKRILRETKKQKIIENAQIHGYKVKKEITRDNKIKLVLQKRVY